MVNHLSWPNEPIVYLERLESFLAHVQLEQGHKNQTAATFLSSKGVSDLSAGPKV